MISRLKWLAGGAVAALALVAYWMLGGKKRAPKREVDAAVERAKADAIQPKPIPDNINDVIVELKRRGEIN